MKYEAVRLHNAIFGQNKTTPGRHDDGQVKVGGRGIKVTSIHDVVAIAINFPIPQDHLLAGGGDGADSVTRARRYV